jgi:hypothetical protein
MLNSVQAVPFSVFESGQGNQYLGERIKTEVNISLEDLVETCNGHEDLEKYCFDRLGVLLFGISCHPIAARNDGTIILSVTGKVVELAEGASAASN